MVVHITRGASKSQRLTPQFRFGVRSEHWLIMAFWTHLVVIVTLWAFQDGVMSQNKNETNFRQKRLFSIFNIVTFKNDPCTTTGAGNLRGTCMDSTSCSSKGGTASGNCAAGFGVCCLFIVNGACTAEQTIFQNCTYIRNDGYPAADTTASETCEYKFNRISENLCQIRLDFETLKTEFDSTGACGTAADAITVRSPFSNTDNGFPPTVCGTLTGQHMYFETGNTDTTAGTLAISKGTGAGSRSYEIKVTYLTCDNTAKAPEGCTQYFTGESGSLQSYNFANGQLLTKQNYQNCFRQEEGYCRLQIRESAVTTPDPFALSNTATDAETDCQPVSTLSFPSGVHSGYCGGALNTVDTSTDPVAQTSVPGSPFQVGLRTLETTLAGFTGFNLDFKQIPCD
ncbi:uncharacterized protein LOC131876800 [Tigriopus californicus]|uniref:uncharacterized protein LOC131876800 n=1 Tax=Tigriopus californicus TaxID=6832 RepID=UPI0027D9F608|nr:uncharacterized protein LOC131876800 [Tigriopus californicus]